jgi:hypothetical protein
MVLHRPIEFTPFLVHLKPLSKKLSKRIQAAGRKTRTRERGLGNTNYPCVQREANVGIFGVLEICFFAAFRYRFVTFRAD